MRCESGHARRSPPMAHRGASMAISSFTPSIRPANPAKAMRLLETNASTTRPGAKAS
jgi:hypothetical protein